MKIDIWYDEIAVETDVSINDEPVEKNDVFGFLYPVRNYPLQTWLYHDSSGQGLEARLRELAYDEEVELVFHGRSCDYDDVAAALENSPAITARFSEWLVRERYVSVFRMLKERMDDVKETVRRKMEDIGFHRPLPDFEISHTEDGWYRDVYSDADLDAVINDDRFVCCLVHRSFFSAYDRLRRLNELTGYHMIPADAVVCCFDDREKLDEYMYYASAYPDIRFRFALEEDNPVELLSKKYGEPLVFRTDIDSARASLRSLLGMYREIYAYIRELYNDMNANSKAFYGDGSAMYEQCRELVLYLELTVQGVGLISDYIDTLLSISKENKEDELHYQCIDGLSERIEEYLSFAVNDQENAYG